LLVEINRVSSRKKSSKPPAAGARVVDRGARKKSTEPRAQIAYMGSKAWRAGRGGGGAGWGAATGSP